MKLIKVRGVNKLGQRQLSTIRGGCSSSMCKTYTHQYVFLDSREAATELYIVTELEKKRENV